MIFLQLANPILSYYNLQWEFSNIQFIILFFCLYNIKNNGVVVFNYVLPLLKSYEYLVMGQINNVSLYVVLLVILFIDVTYIFKSGQKKTNKSVFCYAISVVFFILGWWGMLHLVQDFSIVNMLLRTIGFIILGSVMQLLYHIIRNIEIERLTLEHDIRVDELTGANNRAEFDKVKNRIFQMYEDQNKHLGVAMFDIDYFKQFNDHYGYTVGDGVLQETVRRVHKSLLKNQTGGELFRVGGEEFLIIFRDHSADAVGEIMMTVQKAVASEFSNIQGKQININISCGVTEKQADDTEFSDIYNRVDGYLYQSKQQGRNRITIEGKTSIF